MLPLGDENSGRRIVPVVTYALIAINVLVYFFIELQAADIEAFIMRWGSIPTHLLAGARLETLITSMFLHDPTSILHLASNMLYLWIFGDNIEDAFGHLPYLVFYLVCGVVASVAQALASPSAEVPGVGASGAIAGVLGAYIVLFGGNRIRVLLGRVITTVPSYVMIGLWIVLQLVSGFGSIGATGGGVAYWAHIGGFVAGLLLTFVLRSMLRRPEAVSRQRRAAVR
ncbi:MAG TPA: rhomboid family intramembrane serine protease [Roseiflexaceae bacterium]|nr:rhomboid family intramembrane serine protease [Roseiflexaceae bacterium]